MSEPPLTDGELGRLEVDIATRLNFAKVLHEDVRVLVYLRRALAELKDLRKGDRRA